MRIAKTITIALAAALAAACVTESSPGLTHTPAQLPEASRLNTQIGFDHLRNGRRADAVEKFEKAIEQDPKNPNAFLGLAMVNEQVGDEAEARRRYEQADKVGAADPVVQNAYGAWLCKIGEHDEAVEHFMIAAKNLRYQTPEVALTNAGVCLRRAKQDAAAEEKLRAALQENPRYPLALAELADLALARGDALRARAFVQRLMEAGRPDPRALLIAYRTELANKDARAAQRYADQLKRDYPDSPQAKELGGK